MSHIDTLDPKPGRPTQGEFEPIKTSVHRRLRSREIFPELAKQMKHVALIRSIAGTNGDHGRATYQLQTSYAAEPQPAAPGRRLGGGQRAASRSATCPPTSPSAAWPPRPATWARSARPTSSAGPARRTPTWPSPAGIAAGARQQAPGDPGANQQAVRAQNLPQEETGAAPRPRSTTPSG